MAPRPSINIEPLHLLRYSLVVFAVYMPLNYFHHRYPIEKSAIDATETALFAGLIFWLFGLLWNRRQLRAAGK